ncbi:MAG: 4'-phosphopantetheinyl transferase superfamily protein [Bacteroidetes bacterium]|nr:4'-phosphopantetheinyl transferase superfamily protein [Bacteroidota bacterium]
MSQIPADMQGKVRKYKRWQDAQSSLLGKNLLIKGLKKYGFHKSVLHDIRYTPYMRPYFPNNINFNISHSGNCVVCAISSDFELGIDVEEIRPIVIRDFDSQFNENEMSNIYGSDDKLFAFYDLWTKKEAVIKADGRGMSVPLKSVVLDNFSQVMLKDRKWHVKQIDLNSLYCINIAAAGCLDNKLRIEKLCF